MTSRKRSKPAAPAAANGAPSKNAGRAHEEQAEERASFPIVGIGGSAGGLEAFTQLLKALPADTGMGFVIISHLSPTHPSMLAPILSRATTMPVLEVQDEPDVQPNHVYVIPPHRTMVIRRGKLALLPRQQVRGQHRAVDAFFEALAADQGHLSIGVVLSGTGTDGTAGMSEIKAHGGITFAQDDSAQHNGMPRSAITAGAVDFILPPDGISAEIARIAHHAYVASGAEATPPEGTAETAHLATILHLLHQRTGMDFMQYKRNTLSRRIARRMLLRGIDAIEDYVVLLRGDPGEVDAMYHDILINVTSFFRDPDAFEALKTTVFPQLARDHSMKDPLRVWVLGCSTGEEAYSLAIALTEYFEQERRAVAVQIFATDLNAATIDRARAGNFPKSIVEQVSPERLRRFFHEIEGGYRINKVIRDVCIFARHNGLTDPPFSRMDLISCRNLLIYLDPSAQEKLIPVLHYALNPSGFLWLGSSETIGAHRGLFETTDAKHRIYAKKAKAPPLVIVAAKPRPIDPADTEAKAGPSRDYWAAPVNAQREADRILLSRYTPPGVVINSELEILQFRGDTARFLAPAPGKASLHLLKMLRDGLLVGVKSALARATKDKAPIREEGLIIRTAEGVDEVDIEVVPIKGRSPRDDCFIVLFDTSAHRSRAGRTGASKSPAQRVSRAKLDEEARLKQELLATKDYIQSMLEQQEASNEELQSANEEIQSSNEELQSINEELETSKEEIQSSNEELATVNDELQTRNHELTFSNNDLLNLLSSVQMPMVMLGPDLRIRRFTPKAEEILNLIPADVGRPIGDIKLSVDIPDVEQLVRTVIDTGNARQWEAQDRRGAWYSVRIRPYKTVENKIDGAVLVFVDVDSLKRSEEALRESEGRFRALADSAPVLIWVNDTEGCEFVNSAYLDFVGAPQDHIRGLTWMRFVHPDDYAGYADAYATAAARREPFQRHFRFRRADGVYRWMKAVALPRSQNGRGFAGYVGATFDITDLKEAEEGLRHADQSKDEFLAMLGHELRNPLASLRNVIAVLQKSGMDRPMLDWGMEMFDRQVSTLVRMVDDLLDVSRITRGTVELRRQPTDLIALLGRVVEQAQPIFFEREQQVVVKLMERPVVGNADPMRIEQAVLNLLNNASKFTPRGGTIWITATLQAALQPPVLEIRIRDSGQGISPDLLPHVFDLFTQADRSLERTQGGLGIGLTVVRSVMLLHGGSVEAASEGVGHGSEFMLRLPALPAVPVQRPFGSGRVGGRAPNAPRRILIVDDNGDASTALGMVLRREQHEVELARDGIEGLAKADAFHPDVVLLDLGLPELNGYEVARQLRMRTEFADTLIVAMTGYGGDAVVQQAHAAGFDWHLTKPISLTTLYEVMRGDAPRAE